MQHEQLSQVVHPEHLAQEQLSPMFAVVGCGLGKLKVVCVYVELNDTCRIVLRRKEQERKNNY